MRKLHTNMKKLSHLKSRASREALKPHLRGGKNLKERHKIIPSEKSPSDSLLCVEANPDTVAMESCSGMYTVSSGLPRMQEWEELGTPLPVIRGLYDQGFTHPTPIQKQSIPPAVQDHYDIIGAAETVRIMILSVELIN